MTPLLTITRAKPNPIGRDRTVFGAPKIQLAAEWIDIANTSGTPLDIGTGVQILNIAYDPGGTNPRWKLVYEFNFGDKNRLPIGYIIRLHSGPVIPLSDMRPEDRDGVHFHLFTNKNNYVWNNKLPDQPCIYDSVNKITVDEARYSAPVPNGKILVRQGDRLI
jgi:hypothetical protein